MAIRDLFRSGSDGGGNLRFAGVATHTLCGLWGTTCFVRCDMVANCGRAYAAAGCRPALVPLLVVALCASVAHAQRPACSVSSCSTNAPPSTDCPFTFYHLPKTSGTSLRDVLHNVSVSYNVEGFIPCKNGIPCYVTSSVLRRLNNCVTDYLSNNKCARLRRGNQCAVPWHAPGRAATDPCKARTAIRRPRDRRDRQYAVYYTTGRSRSRESAAACHEQNGFCAALA
jgi:hypothetical protein